MVLSSQRFYLVTGLSTTSICVLITVYKYLLYIPMIELKPRSPVWCAQQCLQNTRQIYERVTHQQEHGQKWSEIVDVSNQYAALTYAYSQ